MGMKLYPPVVENTLPACYKNEKGIAVITIPFSMNRAVSAAEVGGFELKIKTIQTGSYLGTYHQFDSAYYVLNDKASSVTFYIDDILDKMKPGQFYKIQLAYVFLDKKEVEDLYRDYLSGKISYEEYESLRLKISTIGYYSTTSLMKYTVKPKIYINDFASNKLNSYTYKFIGYYDQENGDTTEKVYSYCFNIYNKDNILVHTSGEHIHNSSSELDSALSTDTFSLYVDLEYDTLYYVQYTVTTINNLVISSPRYRMIQRETILPEIDVTLKTILNFDNGYIDLELIPTSNAVSSGSFVICRADDTHNFNNWEEIFKFKLHEEKPGGIIYRDYTFEQGKKYQYCIQQYNDYGLYSKKILSEIIEGDFEDAFLFDGKRQLKIRYNSKVSKLTKTILESKQDTIGNQYPYFFKNGIVNYAEFPIAGLISYYMDEENLFLSKENLITDERTINYTSDNIAQERLFKTEVLKWLNNGQPKLFRSATEGNFIVRLMKVSLSPEDKLGRLLHNFNCTAYEIADYTNTNLRKLQLLDCTERDLYIEQEGTISLNGRSPSDVIMMDIPQNAPLTNLHFTNLFPGDIIQIAYRDGAHTTHQIGETRNLYFDDVLLSIYSIRILPRYRRALIDESTYSINKYYIFQNNEYLLSSEPYNNFTYYYEITNTVLQGSINYKYMIKKDNSFRHIKRVSYGDAIIKQYIGEHNILRDINKAKIKEEIIELQQIRVSRRPVDKVAENPAIPDEFYFGTTNENGEWRSERMPKIELLYPIGLRAYEPETYYVIKNGRYVKEDDPNGVWQPNTTYYLKGRYRPTQYPVGKVAYKSNYFFFRQIDQSTGEEFFIKDTNGEWIEGQRYYEQYKTSKGKIAYREVQYVTYSSDYVFQDSKFYREAHSKRINGENKVFYTLARKFNPEFYERKEYYYLDDSFDEYVDAYVTIEKNYVYKPYTYYIHITNTTESGAKDIYVLNTSMEFNVSEYKTVYGDTFEYEDNYVLKYYTIKNTLPHILHQIGSGWDASAPRDGYLSSVYNFKPTGYKDFYNNKNYGLSAYAPYLEINGKQYEPEENSMIILNANQIAELGEITSIQSGNGVIVDIIYQTKDYEYIIEDNINKAYLTSVAAYDAAIEKLFLEKNNANYIDLNNISHNEYSLYYNNTYSQAIQSNYNSLLRTLDQYV